MFDIVMRKKKRSRRWEGPSSHYLETRTEGYSHDELLASQKRVADELASSKRHGAVVVRHGCDVICPLGVVEETEWREERNGLENCTRMHTGEG